MPRGKDPWLENRKSPSPFIVTFPGLTRFTKELHGFLPTELKGTPRQCSPSPDSDLWSTGHMREGISPTSSAIQSLPPRLHLFKLPYHILIEYSGAKLPTHEPLEDTIKLYELCIFTLDKRWAQATSSGSAAVLQVTWEGSTPVPSHITEHIHSSVGREQSTPCFLHPLCSPASRAMVSTYLPATQPLCPSTH